MSMALALAPVRVPDDVVDEIARTLAACGCQMRRQTDPYMIRKVISYMAVNGAAERAEGLAVDAILIEPRPQWMRDLIGGDLMRVQRGAR